MRYFNTDKTDIFGRICKLYHLQICFHLKRYSEMVTVTKNTSCKNKKKINKFEGICIDLTYFIGIKIQRCCSWKLFSNSLWRIWYSVRTVVIGLKCNSREYSTLIPIWASLLPRRHYCTLKKNVCKDSFNVTWEMMV